jgi:thiol-disulfide isomerase/thioredoxin
MISLINLVLVVLLQDGGFVVTDGPTVPSFVVTEKASTTPKAEKPEAIEVVKPVEDAAVNVKPRYFFRFFTADWCGSCREFKNAGRLKELQELTDVEVIDIDKDKSYSDVPSIPRVRLYDRETGKQLYEWVGNQQTLSMRARYAEKVSAMGKAPERDNSFYGRTGTSHESRQTLIKHLLDDGIHKSRHTRQSLEGMSDKDLVELHDKEHEDAGDVVRDGLWRKK